MRERLQRPEATLRELQRFHQRYTLEDIERDPHLEWALRYGLLEDKRFAEQIQLLIR